MNEEIQPNSIKRQYDALEQILAARQSLSAPENLAESVIAKIASVPQFDALDEALRQRPLEQTPANLAEKVIAKIAHVSQYDALDEALKQRSPLKAPVRTVSNVLAQIQNLPQAATLDKVLAQRPLEPAPRDLSANVLAAIAQLPQAQTGLEPAVAIRVAKPQIKYFPPVVQPLPELPQAALVLAPTPAQENRFIRFALVAAIWVTSCVAMSYLVVPLVINWWFGYPSDVEMIMRLEFSQAIWATITGFMTELGNNILPILPTIISMTAGITMLLIVFNWLQRQKFSQE